MALALSLVTSMATPTVAFADPVSAGNAQSQLDQLRSSSTAHSVAAVDAAIAALEAVPVEDSAGESAAQFQVDQAFGNLVSTLPLTAAIASTEIILDGDYTAFSESKLSSALLDGRSLLSGAQNPSLAVSGSEISGAVTLLDTAKAELVDISGLRASIAAAEAKIALGVWTNNTTSNTRSYVQAAQAVLDTPNATQSDVNRLSNNVTFSASLMIDISEMKANYNQFITLPEADYTVRSQVFMSQYLDYADVLLADDRFGDWNVTKARIDEANSLYHAAMANMVSKRALADAVASAVGLTAGDFTVSSWTGLRSALTAAEATVDRTADVADAVSQADVDNSTTDLTVALGALVFIAPLTAKVFEAGALNEVDYRSAGWAVFQSALADATDLLAMAATMTAPVTAADVTTVLTDLTTAMAGLEDLSTLKAAAAAELALAEIAFDNVGPDFTAYGVAKLDAAIERLSAVIAAPTESGLIGATTDSVSARGSLVDAASLVAAVAASAGKSTDNTVSSQDAFDTAVASANGLLDGVKDAAVEVTAAEILAATSALDAATADLVDLAALRASVHAAGAADVSGKTARSAAEFHAAEAAARAALGDDDATALQVSSAASQMNTAITDLVSVTLFQEARDYALDLEENDYTPHSWADVAGWLSAADSLNTAVNDPGYNVSASDIAVAVTSFVSAFGKLVRIKPLKEIYGYSNVNGAEFTASSFLVLTSARDAASALLDRAADPTDPVTQAEVADAYIAVNTALAVLVSTRAAAEKHATEVAAFDVADYTAASASAMSSALAALDSLISADATVLVTAAQLRDAIDAVDTAKGALVPIADLMNLPSFDLDAMKAEYSAASFARFAAAVNAARALLAQSADVTVVISAAQANGAVNSVFLTMSRLVSIGDLNSAVAGTSGLVEARFTAGSWATFAAALANAAAIAVRSADASTAAPVTQAEADDAVDALQAAVDGLVAVPAVAKPGAGAADVTGSADNAGTAGAGVRVLAYTGAEPVFLSGGALALLLGGVWLTMVSRRVRTLRQRADA